MATRARYRYICLRFERGMWCRLNGVWPKRADATQWAQVMSVALASERDPRERVVRVKQIIVFRPRRR